MFIDTSGWASLFVNTQTYHTQADRYFRLAIQQRKDIITSNYVLAELVALLDSPLRVPRPRIFEVIEAIKAVPYVQVFHIDESTDMLAWNLCKSRPGKASSLVDCSSFVIMRQLNIYDALTTDRHFEQAGFIRLLK